MKVVINFAATEEFTMLFIDNTGITDASINLAIEEYALKHLPMDESYLLFISTAHPSS